ncbi:polysaccharide biosynthesis protein [Bifidobacterium dolichotidis]|uniref:Polysaccharide biosynthesis protein n=2 Tax=Bifidobacterium dolichotidis TaxID=2306976 RepID=A0A430FSQ5_9BIFI|nr:polysaccharide biosynthesis protein [Bifidobacterium dolichotidis]
MERAAAQLVAFVVSIVLARLLSPREFGLIAIITVFTSLLAVFVDSGLGTSLIQKKDADELDFSSVFYFNLFACVVLYAALFMSAPLISDFYHMPELTWPVRILGLTLVITGVKSIQQSFVAKNLLFKRFFWATLIGTVSSAAVGIAMAVMGFGVWALIAQQISNAVIDTAVLWITVRWRPHLCFSWDRLRSLLSMGWKFLTASLIDTAYSNLRDFVIGKRYSSVDLAFFNRGRSLPSFIFSNVNISLNSVLLPVLSRAQDSVDRLRQITRRSLQIGSFFVWPMAVGLAVTAGNIVDLLFGPKWAAAVPYLQIYAFVSATTPIQVANVNAIKAVGRADTFLWLEVCKKIIGTAIVFIALPFGVVAIALSAIVYSAIAFVLNTRMTRRIVNYSCLEQLRDMLPFMGLSVVMGIAVWAINFLSVPVLLQFTIQVILGLTLYLSAAALLRIEAWQYTKNIVVGLLKKKK